MRSDRLLQLLATLLACLALFLGPVAALAPTPGAGPAGVEEESERTERTEAGGETCTDATLLVRERRLQARPAIGKAPRPASRRVPGLVAARTPTPPPSWTRPLRC